jgi:hypothetical protein
LGYENFRYQCKNFFLKQKFTLLNKVYLKWIVIISQEWYSDTFNLELDRFYSILKLEKKDKKFLIRAGFEKRTVQFTLFVLSLPFYELSFNKNINIIFKKIKCSSGWGLLYPV